jgi:hypothetical protein
MQAKKSTVKDHPVLK